MSRPIKHACVTCGYPRWRHKEENRQPKTCERFKTAKQAEKEAARAESAPPVCPEPMTGGE